MGSYNLNGWTDIEPQSFAMTAGVDNVLDAWEYMLIVPATSGNRLVAMNPPAESVWWIAELANADPTQTMDITLVGGTLGQSPPQFILPPGYSSITLKPGYTQRFVHSPGTGWHPLFSAILVP